MTSPTAADDMPSLLSTLAAQLRGDLLVRGDAATSAKFDAQRHRSWNKDLSIRAEPCAFAMVSGVKDVVTVVKFCAENGVKVTVRGKGAHSPWGMAQVRERSHSRKIPKIFSILIQYTHTRTLISHHLLENLQI